MLPAALGQGVYCARRTQPWLRYEDIITEALRVYNDAQRGRPLFRLVEATLPFRLNSTARVPLNFRIRQTVCISTWERLQQSESCAFQEGGEERICTGLFSKVRLRRSLTISCDRDCGRRDQGRFLEQPDQTEVAEAPEKAEASEAVEAPEEAEASEVAEAPEEAEASEVAEAPEEAEASEVAEGQEK
ncbi:15 kDa protein B-like isoform X2 [Cavia porcellus]|uniref:15 kDa protein B-like isoform X2 n=1 Tax=Cavia porcellus TaxID=10141 RepID=UPI00066195F6